MTRTELATAGAKVADYVTGITNNQEESYALLNVAQGLIQLNMQPAGDALLEESEGEELPEKSNEGN